MGIRVALHHITSYRYDRLVALSPHEVRLRPAPHSRTPVLSYSLSVLPTSHFINWQQDPNGNFVARFVFPETTRELSFTVDLVADMTVINPFDFFIEQFAENFPFRYTGQLQAELASYTQPEPAGPLVLEWVARVRRDLMVAPIGTTSSWWRSTSGWRRTSPTWCAWSPASRFPKRRCNSAAAPAETAPGSWCRSCGSWAWPRGSSPAT